MKGIKKGSSFILFACVLFSTNAVAQFSPPCTIEPPLTDTNGDGFADEYVSPQARVIRSELDCSELNIQAAAVVIDSTILRGSIIEPNARVIRSTITDGATIKRGAKIIDSGVAGQPQSNRVSVVIGEGAVVARNSFVTDFSDIAPGVRIIDSTVEDATIGERSLLRESRIRTVDVRSDVSVIGAQLFGNGSPDRFRSVFLPGSRILPGSIILGPISFGENNRIGRNVLIEGFKFFGSNSRIGNDTKIGPGGDILELTTGRRVVIGGEPDIGAEVRIGSDSIIGGTFTTGNDVKIGREVEIGNVVTIGDLSVVGSRTNIGGGTTVGTEAVIGRNAVLGQSVTVGDSSIVRASSVVPEGFIIEANTVYPNDYPNPVEN